MKRDLLKLIIEELRYDIKENVIEIKVLGKNRVEITFKPDFVMQVIYHIDVKKCQVAIWRDKTEFHECYPAIFHKTFDTIDDLKYFLQTKENYLQQLSILYQKEKLLIKEMGE